MARLLLGILWITTLLNGLPTLAIHAEEAGVVDWHKELIGDTLTGNPALAPVFHRVGEENEATKSYILTATTSNVLAALHPENGSIAWRHLYEEKDPIVSFKKYKDVVATASGAGGTTFRLFDIHTGSLIIEQQLSQPNSERILNPPSLGVAFAFDPSRNHIVYALTGGHVIKRFDTTTGGTVEWTWAAQDQTSLVVYSAVIPTGSAVYAIGLAKSFASYTLHITALSTVDGTVLADVDVPSSITGDGPSSFLALSMRNKEDPTEYAAVRIAWLEGGTIKSVGLTAELKGKPVSVKGAAYEKIIDAGLGDYGMFVALKDDGSGRVIKLSEEEKGLKVIWEFADSAKAAHYTEAIYTGGVDKDGYPYVARVFWSHAYKKASAHILAPHLADGKGLVTGFTFPFETNVHGIIAHATVDAANPEEFRVLARLVLSTTTGAVQLWQHDQLQWTREEGLTDIRVAEFVELPERAAVAAPAGTAEEAETFVGRLQRQLLEARNFPQYVSHFASRFVSGSGALGTTPVAPVAESTEGGTLVRDPFGFRKILVVATSKGKVYGLDSASGEIVWSRVFGLGWAAKVGARIVPAKIFTVNAVGDSEEQRPQVVLVTQRLADNGLIDTVLFHIDALTGEDVAHPEETSQGSLLEGVDAIAGALVEAFLVRDGTTKYLLLLDEFLQGYIYPDAPAHTSSFKKRIPSLHIPLITQSGITGHRLSTQEEFTGRHVAQSAWTLSLAPNESIQKMISRPVEPVASLGKVLGDRSTLYKYLNPNMAIILTATSAAAQNPGADEPKPAGALMETCGVYAIDTVKGTILYHTTLPAAFGVCDVKTAFAENWLVFIYYDPEMGRDQAKGYQVVSVEFYEGTKVDEKIRSSDLSSYAPEMTNITIYEQAYVFPRAVTALATTSTKFGISSKELIVAGENGIIQAFPRRFLDPRRPKRKPTSQEQEEWLIQYDPVIPDDPKRVLSHVYPVLRIRNIVTSPALLESTSLVFAYGLDLFSTRIAPSNTFDVLSESFNKAQLVLTIAGLSVAILVSKPMVTRKRLRERWYN